MTRPYSGAFKQKMIRRLTGNEAVSATQIPKETGARQQDLSGWLAQAHKPPVVAAEGQSMRRWSLERKAPVLAEGSKLRGSDSAYGTWRPKVIAFAGSIIGCV